MLALKGAVGIVNEEVVKLAGIEKDSVVKLADGADKGTEVLAVPVGKVKRACEGVEFVGGVGELVNGISLVFSTGSLLLFCVKEMLRLVRGIVAVVNPLDWDTVAEVIPAIITRT